MAACFVLLGLQLGRVRDLSPAAGARLVRGLQALPGAIADVVEQDADIAAIAQRYAGASFVTRGNSFRTYDWNKAADLLGQLWAGYDLDTEIDNFVVRGTDATGTGG